MVRHLPKRCTHSSAFLTHSQSLCDTKSLHKSPSVKIMQGSRQRREAAALTCRLCCCGAFGGAWRCSSAWKLCPSGSRSWLQTRRATVPWPYCTCRQQTTSPYRSMVRSN